MLLVGWGLKVKPIPVLIECGLNHIYIHTYIYIYLCLFVCFLLHTALNKIAVFLCSGTDVCLGRWGRHRGTCLSLNN